MEDDRESKNRKAKGEEDGGRKQKNVGRWKTINLDEEGRKMKKKKWRRRNSQKGKKKER